MKGDVVIVGANPAVQLFDGDEATVMASLWRVDWSEHGNGWALVLAAPDRSEALVMAEDVALGGWLADTFNRHFGEFQGWPFGDPIPLLASFDVSLDLDEGLTARCASRDVTVDLEIREPLCRRVIEVDDLSLGEVGYDLRNALFPCRHARVVVDGRAYAGQPRVVGVPDEPESSAFLAVAEIWTVRS